MKITMKPALAAALLLTGMGLSARAQEAIQTGPAGSGAPPSVAPEAQPQGDPEQSPEAIGAWARGVLAGAPAEKAVADGRPSGGKRCAPPEDRKPHGEVWGGIGTGGYREVGGIVTQPVGDCGQVTVAVDRVEGGRRH